MPERWDITVKRNPCPGCCIGFEAHAWFDLCVDEADDDNDFIWKCRNCGEIIPAIGIEPVPFNTDETITTGQVEALLLEEN